MHLMGKRQRAQRCVSRKRIQIWGELGIGVEMVKTHCRNSQQTNTKKKVKRKLTRYVWNILPQACIQRKMGKQTHREPTLPP